MQEVFVSIRLNAVLLLVLFSGVLSAAKEEPGSSVWNCQIYPCEHKIVTDPVTGYPLRFITTAGATDRAFYFTHNSFLPDGSMIVFSSDRSGRSEYFGYLTATGELAQLLPPGATNAGLVCVASTLFSAWREVVGVAVLSIKKNRCESVGASGQFRQASLGSVDQNADAPC